MWTKQAEIFSSILNLAGGVILALDALRQRRRVSAERGSEQFLDIVAKHNLGEDVEDGAGNKLSTTAAFQNWFAERTQHVAWAGFVFMSLGFTLDIIAKWYAP